MVKKRILVTITDEDWLYLIDKGIPRSALLEQAIAAHREGKFDYDYRKGANVK